ncbi:hypothetical protein AB0M44_20030 [Streptosporangium subroseum]|uniref:hypothetical protein n=1 Tax=Streptosporangium subroseum TaxID=106412 RepID=UPI00343E1093
MSHENHQPVTASFGEIANLVEIQDVATVAFSAERLEPGNGQNLHLSMNAGAASADRSLSFKFDVTGQLIDEDSKPVANLAISLVATYAPRDKSLDAWVDEKDQEALKLFCDAIAWRDVYPFVREGVASLMAKLGIHGCQLPVLRLED